MILWKFRCALHRRALHVNADFVYNSCITRIKAYQSVILDLILECLSPNYNCMAKGNDMRKEKKKPKKDKIKDITI